MNKTTNKLTTERGAKMNDETIELKLKIKRLEVALYKLVSESKESLESDHLTKYAGGFESARLKIKAETEAQLQVFNDIIDLLNDEKVNFKNQNSVIKLDDVTTDLINGDLVERRGLHVNNKYYGS